jgi:ribulose-phosphate 3-epimerase
MLEIVPAILEADTEAFRKRFFEIGQVSDVKRIQVDFADGIFVSNQTFMPADLESLDQRYKWEAHLMVQNPERYVNEVKSAGFNSVIVHYEAADDLKALAEKIREIRLESLLAINPNTEVEAIAEHLHLFDGVVVMSVVPGHQGGEFLEGTFEKLEKLKKDSENLIIEVDGGIKLEHVLKLKELGADRLVVGSALLEGDFKHNFERFETEIQK